MTAIASLLVRNLELDVPTLPEPNHRDDHEQHHARGTHHDKSHYCAGPRAVLERHEDNTEATSSYDSQDQRHRMVPGSRPLLTLADTREPDYLTPMLVAGNAKAREVYGQAMADAWQAKNELLDRGAPREVAMYLLPNAKAIRLVETGSLLHLLHKWTMRTCFNAQEEIYQASMEELDQLRVAVPELAKYVGPPCYLRAGIATPICTEGSHFCGVKVWTDFPQIQRRI